MRGVAVLPELESFWEIVYRSQGMSCAFPAIKTTNRMSDGVLVSLHPVDLF
jgi:hypothetical protein